MKKYEAFGLILSAVHSVKVKASGLAKPEAEKFVTNAVFADGLLVGRKNWPSVLAIFASFLT